MICETCWGRGAVPAIRLGGEGKMPVIVEIKFPCPTCEGRMFTFCCDGDRAQPEGEREDEK